MERVRRLRKTGVLRDAHQSVSREACGIGLEAMIFVRLSQHDRDRVEAFRRYAEGLVEVVAVFHVGGEHDFVVHVAARDSEHLRDLAMDAFTARDEVSHIETHLIFARSEWPSYPLFEPTAQN
jgi:DNA-binding Lrp family transcriptional regulator